MRCLNRNKVKFYYALYQGRTPIEGTGEYAVQYSAPVACMGNISPASGNIAIELFGGNEGYDKVLVMDKAPIDEYSVLWIDALPTASYDYIVRKVAKSLNSVAIAVSKVNVE